MVQTEVGESNEVNISCNVLFSKTTNTGDMKLGFTHNYVIHPSVTVFFVNFITRPEAKCSRWFVFHLESVKNANISHQRMDRVCYSSSLLTRLDVIQIEQCHSPLTLQPSHTQLAVQASNSRWYIPHAWDPPKLVQQLQFLILTHWQAPADSTQSTSQSKQNSQMSHINCPSYWTLQ